MKQLEYSVRFTTPAFLGNAEQSGQWRTPPFKALLRQWWRVAYAADHGFAVDVANMRREEGLLFGHAWLEGDTFERNGKMVTTAARKSLVRMRLDCWDEGKLKSWNGLEQETVHHPNVEKTGYKIGPHAYLGFGPLTASGGTKLDMRDGKRNAAIQAGETAMFAIAFPTTHQDAALKQLAEANAPRIERALWLMDRYGTLGGRSRNGWGSFALLPSPVSGRGAGGEGALPLRDWRQALALDWPHAIGQDDQGPLIWQTEPFDDWKVVMRRLAEIKIGLRTQFRFTTGKGAAQPEDRHWLSYPVTNHSVAPWGGNARLPNSLRFKVRPAPGDGDSKKLVGAIFHVPCLPPPSFQPNRTAIESVWQRVHGFLDAPAQKLARAPW